MKAWTIMPSRCLERTEVMRMGLESVGTVGWSILDMREIEVFHCCTVI